MSAGSIYTLYREFFYTWFAHTKRSKSYSNQHYNRRTAMRILVAKVLLVACNRMPLRIERTPAIYDHHNMFLSGIKKNVARVYNTMRARAMHTLLRFVEKKILQWQFSWFRFVWCVVCNGNGQWWWCWPVTLCGGTCRQQHYMNKCRPLHAVPLHYLAAAVPTDDLAVASQCPLCAP